MPSEKVKVQVLDDNSIVMWVGLGDRKRELVIKRGQAEKGLALLNGLNMLAETNVREEDAKNPVGVETVGEAAPKVSGKEARIRARRKAKVEKFLSQGMSARQIDEHVKFDLALIEELIKEIEAEDDADQPSSGALEEAIKETAPAPLPVADAPLEDDDEEEEDLREEENDEADSI